MRTHADYASLDAALDDIAARSFYESATIQRMAPNIYRVTDHHTGIESNCMWTYDHGPELEGDTGHVIEFTRTHETCESYDSATHVRFNLADAVEAIESYRTVGFTYVIADAYCDDECETHDTASGERVCDCECSYDHTAGWLLVATDETDYSQPLPGDVWFKFGSESEELAEYEGNLYPTESGAIRFDYYHNDVGQVMSREFATYAVACTTLESDGWLDMSPGLDDINLSTGE